MPRNGNGSGDSGSYEAREIVHGNTGDDTLQHTKHVAPMPGPEKGEALSGMNASGGAAAPLNNASEEYGASTPRHELRGVDGLPTADTGRGEQSSSNKVADGSLTSRAHHQESSQTTHNSSHEANDLEKIIREKAERYVNLDGEADNQAHSSASKASACGNSKEHHPERAEHQHASEHSSGNDSYSKQAHNKSHHSNDYEGHKFDQEIRHKAEKFVNLEE